MQASRTPTNGKRLEYQQRMAPRRAFCFIPLTLVLVSLPALSAFGDEASDRNALANCVATHFTADDAGAMTRLTVIILTDADRNEEELISALASKRDSIIGSTAILVTRLVEKDCKSEFAAVNSSKAGAGFAALFPQMVALGMGSLKEPGLNRASAAVAIELVKKLDSNVAIELFGPNPTSPSTAAALGSDRNRTVGQSVKQDAISTTSSDATNESGVGGSVANPKPGDRYTLLLKETFPEQRTWKGFFVVGEPDPAHPGGFHIAQLSVSLGNCQLASECTYSKPENAALFYPSSKGIESVDGAGDRTASYEAFDASGKFLGNFKISRQEWGAFNVREPNYARNGSVSIEPNLGAVPLSEAASAHVQKTTFSGAVQPVWYFYSLNPDCTSAGVPIVEVVQAPFHGSILIENVKHFTEYPSTNQRYECNRKKSPGVAVVYTSEKSFVGTDRFAVKSVFASGNVQTKEFVVTVDPPPSAHSETR
jgi:hypothetical protein